MGYSMIFVLYLEFPVWKNIIIIIIIITVYMMVVSNYPTINHEHYCHIKIYVVTT